MKRKALIRIASISCILVAALLNSCSQNSEATEPPTQLDATTVTSIPTPIQPTETITNVAVLLAPPGVDIQLQAEVEAMMRGRLEPLGWRVDLTSELIIDEPSGTPELVVALPPLLGMADIANAHPSTRFIAVGIPGLQNSSNLSVVGGGEDDPARLGFIAGYTAAVVTEDWRVGIISSGDTRYWQGFSAGVHYFCGLCLQNYPPYYEYPLTIEVPPGAPSTQIQEAIDQLIGESVETIYLAPGVGDAASIEYLSQSGIAILGSGHIPEPKPASWIAAIELDLISGLTAAVEAFLQGREVASFPTEIRFLDVNTDILSIGKMEHIQNVIDELLGGWISPVEAAP